MTVAAGPAVATARFRFEVHDDLAPLRGDWCALAAQSDNVFATYEWLSTWWHHFGRGRQLLVTTVHDEASGRLVAILPLYVAATRPVRVVRLLGHGATDQLGPVCAVGDRDRARRALAELLTGPALAGRRWDVAIADELPACDEPPSGARLLARYPTHVVSLDGTTGDEWLAARSSKLRAQLARCGRSLDQLGIVSCRTTDDLARVDQDLDRLLDLHDRRWAGAGGSRSYAGREAFHHDIARTFLDRGWLRLRFLEIDGTAVAAVHSFRFEGVESHYQGGRDPAYDQHSVGLLLHRHAILACADEGVREYRFLRGDEDYKRRLADRVVEQESFAWSRGARGRATTAMVAHLPRLTRAQARWVPASLAWGTGGTPRWGAP